MTFAWELDEKGLSTNREQRRHFVESAVSDYAIVRGFEGKVKILCPFQDNTPNQYSIVFDTGLEIGVPHRIEVGMLTLHSDRASINDITAIVDDLCRNFDNGRYK
jgi:hypothetical protein